MTKLKVIGLSFTAILIGFACLWILTGKWINEGLDPKANGDNDYAIILGAKVNGMTPSLSLQYRLESALEYAQMHMHVSFILSGGQGPDEDMSEAEAMKLFLLNNGISEERLIIEDASTSTYENIKFSKALIPDSIQSVTIITSDYHLSRTKVIADQLGLKTDVVAAKTPKIVELKLRARERIALLKTYLMGK